jgi:hypothetical protein
LSWGASSQDEYRSNPIFLRIALSDPEVGYNDFVIEQSLLTGTSIHLRPIDRVLGAAQGAFGEIVNADWRSCIPVPKEMSWEQAAGIYV